MIVAQKVASFLTLFRSIVFSILIVALAIWNIQVLNQAAVELVSMLPRIQQVEASGYKVVLRDSAKLSEALNTFFDQRTAEGIKRGSTEGIAEKTVAIVKNLSAPEIDRLFTIEPNGVHCEYTKPTATMRVYINADASLEQANLVVVSMDEAKRDEELARTSAGTSNIGLPRSCYRMTLTPLGYDVKSALVGVIKEAFRT